MTLRKSSILLKVLLLISFLFLSSCATMKRPPLTGIVPGKEVETLQSSISISVKSGEHSTSGRGYLIFKQPDRFHMAVLSPFGLTVLEVFTGGDRLTCLIPSRQTAYAGLLSEIPETSGFKSMAMMKWVVARPPQRELSAGSGELTAPNGDHYFYDAHGLVARKVSPEGDQVAYHDYQNVNGVAFPESIVITSRRGDTVKIVFDEPEIDVPVEEAALTPNLEGYNIQPLSEFKGQ